MLNTDINGGGYGGSADASFLLKGGVYFSTSNATSNTKLYGGGASFGSSITPGYNFFLGKYVSRKF